MSAHLKSIYVRKRDIFEDISKFYVTENGVLETQLGNGGLILG